jgi:hypothetical protein
MIAIGQVVETTEHGVINHEQNCRQSLDDHHGA